MMWISLMLLTQSSGDTLRWYDTTTVGYTALGLAGGGDLHWAIVLPIDSGLDGRTVHSGRVHIWEAMGSQGILRLCLGDSAHPYYILAWGYFNSTGYGFYEVFFGDSIVLHEGDTVWLWCTQWHLQGQYPATVDAGPCNYDYGSLGSFDGVEWWSVCTYGINYNWVMELVLVPSEVQEGPVLGPPEELTLLMAPEGFLISGYEGPVQVYDATGRLLLSRDIKGKTLIGPLSPGVYFVRAGKQRGKIAIR